MAIEVAKIELKTVQDASGLEACIARGQFTADEVIAVIGKTEGNGGAAGRPFCVTVDLEGAPPVVTTRTTCPARTGSPSTRPPRSRAT